ncbi:MAG: methyltransferase domain-containing protein [Terriglobia bacterium]
MRRITSRELLDDDAGDPADLEASLLDLWDINRQYGGAKGSLTLLDRVFARTGSRQLRILDVGAGDGRLAAWLRRELARRGFQARICALDQRISHLSYQRPSPDLVERVVADALEMPFQQNSFEVVMCNLFVHHFSGAELSGLLREMLRVSGEAVLVNDLERRWLPYLFVRYGPFGVRSAITRHDAAASVRQAYTRRELTAVASGCSAASTNVIALPFFRLGAILWKTSPPTS